MAVIIPGIITLVQYILTINENRASLIPQYCPTCKSKHFKHHGYYSRNVNYDKKPDDEWICNIPIFRYYCMGCCTTFSALPECIPPLRHYIWLEQQRALGPVLQGHSSKAISESVKPSRWTISRWLKRLKERATIHLDHIRSLLPNLGRVNEFSKSWLTLLEEYDLAHVMRILHQVAIIVP